MAFGDRKVEFSQPVRQVLSMLVVLVLVGAGIFFLFAQIRTVFLANVYLNAFIGAVFVIGVLATFWQVAQLMSAIRWMEAVERGNKGMEISKPPRLVASMTPLLRDGHMSRKITSSTTRTILDSVASRLDEARDITRYLATLLIFLGLLGTFWGLSNTVPAVVETIRSLAPQEGDTSGAGVFERLMTGLEDQLGGMGTAFASSLVGLAGSLVVGLLELFAGHGQNRFFRELEEWLSLFTRIGLVSEGEGSESALVALLERVDEGLEVTNSFAARAEEARATAETRLARAADVIGEMAGQVDRERSMVAELIGEMREERATSESREAATLSVLKRIERGQSEGAAAMASVATAISSRPVADGGAAGAGEQLKSIDRRLLRLSEEISVGRHESIASLRAELRALINLIDARTRDGE